MTLWRRTRTEVAGAWRSVRYDLGRPGSGDPDLTPFGETGTHRYAPVRRPHRLVAFAAAGTLAVAGATGGYLAVVTGAGTPGGADEAAGEPYPLAAAAPGTGRGDRSHEGLGRELLGAALGSKKGEPFTAVSGFGVVVGVINAIRTGDPQQVAMATEQGRQQFTQEMFSDIGEAARTYARTRLKTKADLTLARQALGISTDEAEDAPAGKGQ